MNAKNLIANITSNNLINDVEAIMSEEANREFPRKGVLYACELRIGQLHISGQFLRDILPVEDELTEEVAMDPVVVLLNRLGVNASRVSDETKAQMNVFCGMDSVGKEFTNVNIQPSYYHKHGQRMHEFVKYMSEAARKGGAFTKIINPPKSLAYLHIVWK